MASLVLTGDTSGQVTIAAPAVAGTNTLTLQAATATSAVNTLATAVASTSGTSIDFTGLPSWVKRITVMFAGVSTNGTSHYQIQLGDSGGIETSGYQAVSTYGAGVGTGTVTTGFPVFSNTAADVKSGILIWNLLDSSTNTWVCFGNMGQFVNQTNYTMSTSGNKSLSGTLDRVRITTVNGTDTFDAGSVNILYEG